MMQVFNPTGATGITAPFAPRLKTMHGKKIGLLSNGIWQAHRTLPSICPVRDGAREAAEKRAG